MVQDEDRVFDVSKPHKVGPSPTSKPIIVGHHPIMSDPMVTEHRPEEPRRGDEPAKSTHVPISFDDEDGEELAAASHSAAAKMPIEAALDNSQETFSTPEAPAPPPELPKIAEHHPLSVYPQHEIPKPETPPAAAVPVSGHPPSEVVTPTNQAAPPGSLNDLPLPAHHAAHHAKQPGKAGKKKWLSALLLIAVLVGAYAYADAKTSVSLPFYLFRKSTPATPVQTVAPVVSDPYAGWITYTSTTEPTLSFKYPSNWKITKNAISLGVDSADIISPSGTDIYWGSAGAGVGGQCNAQDTIIVNLVKAIPKASSLYAVKWTTKIYTGSQAPVVTDEMGVVASSPDQTTPPKTGSYTGCIYPMRFTSHKGDKTLSLGVKEGTYQASDLAKLKLIFGSLQY